MVTEATAPSAFMPQLRSERLFATLALALLLSCVFDVGRVLYYRMLLNYAVSHSARMLAEDVPGSADPAVANERAAWRLVRTLSGVKDLPASGVRVDTVPAAVIVTASYGVPLVSPPLWPVFGRDRLPVGAVGTYRTADSSVLQRRHR
jgi:hypothetical protein